jgi:hypothetical protein
LAQTECLNSAELFVITRTTDFTEFRFLEAFLEGSAGSARGCGFTSFFETRSSGRTSSSKSSLFTSFCSKSCPSFGTSFKSGGTSFCRFCPTGCCKSSPSTSAFSLGYREI